jgi:DNA-binding beta-propeller fold protein YncE
MKLKDWHFIFGLASAILGIVPIGLAAAPYHLLKEIQVGGEGGGSCLSIDEHARRLYVVQAGKIVIIDLKEEQVIGAITNTLGVHGFAIAPSLGFGYYGSGQDAGLHMVNLRGLRTFKRITAGKDLRTILYEPGRQQIYAFDGSSHSAKAYEADDGDYLATIQLSGTPGAAASEPKAGLVYCNIEDKDEVLIINNKTRKVVNHWPVAPGKTPSGMAIDATSHRLFIGCANKLMVMMDSEKGRAIATVPIDEGAGGNAFDAGTGLAFTSCGKGTVIIVREETPDKLAVVQTLMTQPGARTMALDPVTHKIYLATASSRSLPEQAAGAERPSPEIVPSGFKVLVYGMDESAKPAK